LNFFSLLKRKIIFKLKKKIKIDTDGLYNKSLDEYFNYYGSDKANFFKEGNRKGHGYSKLYSDYLENLRNKKINILEIGSYAGASAAAFVKYLPNSNIFCFDVNISNFKYKSKKIHVFGIDIKNEKKIKRTLNNIFMSHKFTDFDLIIDDGSHNLSDILISLKFFFKFIKKGGLYIIEDFKHPNYYDYNRNIEHILVDQVLANLQEKKIFNSDIIKNDDQVYLHNNINKIMIYKGNLKNSDICFLQKS